MDESFLLTTKVRILAKLNPPVSRTPLIRDLEAGIPHHKLTLILAPAGYGKTTLLTQWAQSSEFATAWISINQQDNDLQCFLRGLLAAWE